MGFLCLGEVDDVMWEYSERSLVRRDRTGADGPEAFAVIGATLAIALFASAVCLAGISITRSESMEALVWALSFLLAVPVGVLISIRLMRTTSSDALGFAAGIAIALFGTGLLLAQVLSVTFSMTGAVILVTIPAMVLGTLGVKLLGKRARAFLSAPFTQCVLSLLGGICIVLTFATGEFHTFNIVLPSAALAIVGVLSLHLAPAFTRQFAWSHNIGLRIALGSTMSLSIALLAWGVAYRPNWYDQNFFLGPVNEIRNGRFMLVEVVSQYGVGAMYAVEGALSVLGFGYGSFLLLVGLLAFLTLVVIFCVIAATTRSVIWSASGALCAAVAGPIATLYWTEQFPPTGFLRFGPTWILVLTLTLTAQRVEFTKRSVIPASMILGFASIWSFESAFYSIGTFVAVVIVSSLSRRHLREMFTLLLVGFAFVIIAFFLLAFCTLIGSGQLPDPNGYLDFIRLYSSQGFSTLPVADWSMGYAIAGAYIASFIGIGFALVRFPQSEIMSQRIAVPLVGTTMFGFLSFTYFLGRSHPNNLTHISPPFIVMMTIWTWLAAHQWSRSRRPAYLAFVASVFFAASLLVVGQWERVSLKFPDSALAAVLSPITGSPGLEERISTLRSNPVVSARSQVIESLVQRLVPDDAPLLIVAEPSLLTESLIRLDRINAIPLSAPDQDALLPSRRASLIAQAAELPCGTWIVAQKSIPLQYNRDVNSLLSGVMGSVRSSFDLLKVGEESGFQVFVIRCKG